MSSQSSSIISLDSPAKNARSATKFMNDSPAKNTRSETKLRGDSPCKMYSPSKKLPVKRRLQQEKSSPSKFV